MTTAAGSSNNNHRIDPSFRPPSRPKKKRHHSDDDDDEVEEDKLQEERREEPRALQGFYVSEFPPARRRIPFAEHPQQQEESSLMKVGVSASELTFSHNNNATKSDDASTTLSKAPLSTTTGRRNLWRTDSNPTASVRSSARIAARRPTPQAFRPPRRAYTSTRRQEEDEFQDLCQRAQELKTPAEQTRAYWHLVYGADTPQPPAQAAPPLRGVLKKRPNKRGRFQPQSSESFLATSHEEAPLSSFDSPQTGNTPGLYFTPQPSSALMTMDHLPPTATRSNRVVQFGPSQAVSFQAGTPVEGGLEPLPEAEVQFPTDSDSFILDEEEQAALEETKANAACLAEWEGMIDIGDDEDEDDTFVLSARRSGRRSSTFFSPNPKSLLDEPDTRIETDDEDEDDDDKNDGEPNEQHVIHEPEHVNDPVEKLVLSALQVNSPTLGGSGDDSDKNKGERMSTSPMDTVSKSNSSDSCKHDRMDLDESPGERTVIQSPKENVNPDCAAASIIRTENQSFGWEQLASMPDFHRDWIHHFSTCQPLRTFFLAALAACDKDVRQGTLVRRPVQVEPSLGRHLSVELRLMKDFMRHFETLHETAVRTEKEKLEGALRLAYSARPPTPRQIEITKYEAEIAVLEQTIVREQRALALARQRKLQKELVWFHRQIAEWRLLSSLLGDIDFPKEDATSPTGLAYGFPVERLDCEVLLRPNVDRSLDSTSLDVISTDAPGLFPVALVESLRRIILGMLSGMVDEEYFDFQQAFRQTIIFLGRLDRILDDLEGACRLWNHDVMVSTDSGDTVTLEFYVSQTTTYRLIWQILPKSPFVLEYAYPSRVELILDGVATTKDPSTRPPSLRALWNKVEAGTWNQNA